MTLSEGPVTNIALSVRFFVIPNHNKVREQPIVTCAVLELT